MPVMVNAAAMSLVYAWFFGFLPALVLISFASTSGATLAFLLSRYLFRDSIQSRFGESLAAFNGALEREGAAITLRERSLTADSLAREAGRLLDDRAARTEMADAARRHGRPEAAAAIALGSRRERDSR